MRDPFEKQWRTFTRALSRLPRALPKDLRHCSLAELRQRWEDPADRARLVAALTPVARAAKPMIQEVQEFRSQFRGLLGQLQEGVTQLQQFFARTRAQIQAVASSVQRAPRLASDYCAPYRHELAKLEEWHLRPLSPAEEWQFLVSSVFFSTPAERAPGRRPPLQHLALLNDRMDIAVAVLYRAHPELCLSARRDRLPQEWEEIPGEVLIVLQEEVLPNIDGRLQHLTVPEARLALDELLSQQYLLAAVCRNLRRHRRRAARQAPPQVELAEELADAQAQAQVTGEPDAAAVERVVAAYLTTKSDRPELDSQTVAAMRAGRSMAELAREVGEPARTLTHRRKKLLAYCRKELGLED